ncbi:hypothetical protein [Streptomyces decoyicus]
MYGTGNSRGRTTAYRWEFDGTHIYGVEDRCLPSERAYWTDEKGVLVGKSKAGPGQSWTITS